MKKTGSGSLIFKLSVILLLVCAVVAGILGVINHITEDRIAQQKRDKTFAAYAAVLPSDSYETVSFDKAAFGTVDVIEKASGGEGYVVQTTFSGAQGMITMVVGVKESGAKFKCSGISIISHSETSGLGAVAASSSERGESFRSSFVGKDENIRFTDIDAISGATITSKAVTNAVATAIKAVESIA